jgi:hypothetical protein
MKQKELTAALENLLAIAIPLCDEECKLGPHWLSELSLSSLDRLRDLVDASRSGELAVGSVFSLYDELGKSWVDLESEVYELVQGIDQQFFVAPRGPNQSFKPNPLRGSA